jgi:uncharacterized membrane protein
VTRALGRPRIVYGLISGIVAWIGINTLLRALGAWTPDPPPLGWMQAIASASALVMTVVVLTAQNRQAAVAERRAHLDLQVNLLAEQKIAKVIALVEELRQDMPSVPSRRDSLAEAMKEAIDPHAVVAALDGSVPAEPTSGDHPSTGDPSKR